MVPTSDLAREEVTVRAEDLHVVRRRPVAPNVVTAVVLLLVIFVVYSFARSDQIDKETIGQYLFDPRILAGAWATVYLTVAAEALGIALGALIAWLRRSRSAGLRSIAMGYIWIFRGTPVLVQIIVWFNLGLVFPRIGLPLPFTSFEFAGVDTNALITPFTAALLGLGLNEAAYMAEVFRSARLGVRDGEIDAARALGMTRGQVTRRVIVPQMIRLSLPTVGNQLNTMLKTTSLVSVVSFGELLTNATTIFAVNARVLELLFVVSLWYLAMTSLISLGQRWLEKRYGRMDGAAHV